MTFLSASAVPWAVEMSAFQGDWAMHNFRLYPLPSSTGTVPDKWVISLLSSHAHLEAELNHPPTPQSLSAGDFSPLIILPFPTSH